VRIRNFFQKIVPTPNFLTVVDRLVNVRDM